MTTPADARLAAAFTSANGRAPSSSELDALRHAAAAVSMPPEQALTARDAIRARAQQYVGTPYLWGGQTKEGIDCSAFISKAWGVARHTTDSIQAVADPVAKDQLQPGDALNLPTYADPRGYGHVRMFDGWADPAHKSMYVFESSTATNGVARRVIPYDDAYTPLRMKGLAEETSAATSPPEDELHTYARAAATTAGIDPDQFVRQIQQESGFNPTAKSGAGAQGIAQIVPQYHPGVDTSDPHASLDYAANWMGQLTKQYGGDQRKALAHYNGGGGAVAKLEAGTPYDETTRYLDAIAAPSAERQRFLEANAPGESSIPTPPTSPNARPGEDTVGPIDPLTGKPARVLTEQEKADKALVAKLTAEDDIGYHFKSQVPDAVELASPYRLPGPAPVELGWRRMQLPGGY